MAGRTDQPAEKWLSLSDTEYQQIKDAETVMSREKRKRKRVADSLVAWDAVDSLAEVGVGTGEFLRRVAANDVPERHAIDINQSFLDSVSDIATETHRADAAELPLISNSQDAAVALAVLGHLPTERHAAEAIRELVRVTRPGGQVIISVGNPDGLARQARIAYQRARIAAKAVSGLGSDESVFTPLGDETVMSAVGQSARVDAREDITLIRGYSTALSYQCVPGSMPMQQTVSDSRSARQLSYASLSKSSGQVFYCARNT